MTGRSGKGSACFLPEYGHIWKESAFYLDIPPVLWYFSFIDAI